VSDIVQNVPDRDYYTFVTVRAPFDAFIAEFGTANPTLEAAIAGAAKVKYSADELGVIQTLIVSK
jgi:hypothetical protein